jgi:H+/Cl- antiporter ClcA
MRLLTRISPRSRRRLLVLSRRWQRRVIFLCGGVAVGVAAVVLAAVADAAQEGFDAILARFPYGGLFLTPLGFGLIAFLTSRYFPAAAGSGIPQAIAARRLRELDKRAKLVSLRIAAGKIGLTLMGLLVGASIGREGPTVQIGASIMAALGRLSPGRQPGLILAGASAGVAAAFNTPLAGIVFGIEEMSRSFEVRASGLIIGAVILGGLTSLALVGSYTYFGTSDAVLNVARAWLAVPLCGVTGGLLGGLFSRFIVAVMGAMRRPAEAAASSSKVSFPKAARIWMTAHPALFAVVCGLGVALCGLASGGSIHGTGYAYARDALHGTAPDYAFLPMKFAATALSSISGIPGGIFAPSLAIGAGLGADMAAFFPDSAGAVVLLGMVSYFTGVVQAPITAFVIVSEMTGDHTMLVPLMAAALIANAVSKLVCREGIYHALARRIGDAQAPRRI